MLDPATGAKYAEILFPIRNAAAVNRGEKPATPSGSSAEAPLRLAITLEQPTPYILELLTHQTALPVHRASWSATATPSPGRATS